MSGAEDVDTGLWHVGMVVVAEESIRVKGPARVSVGGMSKSDSKLCRRVVRLLGTVDVTSGKTALAGLCHLSLICANWDPTILSYSYIC